MNRVSGLPKLTKYNHFVAGLMWRLNKVSVEVELLTILYKEEGKDAVRKFPGGTNRLTKQPLIFREDETPLETLKREWRTEVWQQITATDPLVVSFSIGRDGHVQHYVLLSELDATGRMRNRPIVDREGGKAAEELGRPEWIPAPKLITEGGEFGLYWSHLRALEAFRDTIKQLASAPETVVTQPA